MKKRTHIYLLGPNTWYRLGLEAHKAMVGVQRQAGEEEAPQGAINSYKHDSKKKEKKEDSEMCLRTVG